MKTISSISFLFLLILAGFHFLMDYSAKPGRVVSSIGSWPQASQLDVKKEKHLVMFLHPGCSCSKASVAELSRLMAEAQELSVQVVMMKSPKLEKLFHENPLINQVKLIPRTKIIYDHDGKESALFGAETSGLTHLYDENSNLLFAGGLTMARGHEGESVGKKAILGFMKGEKSESKSLVFGCDIFGAIKTITMVK